MENSTLTPESSGDQGGFHDFSVDDAGARDGIKNINFSRGENFSEIVAFGAEKASHMSFTKFKEHYIKYASADGGMSDRIVEEVFKTLSKTGGAASGSRSGIGIRTALHNIYESNDDDKIPPYFTHPKSRARDRRCWGIINKHEEKYTFIALVLNRESSRDWKMQVKIDNAMDEHINLYNEHVECGGAGILTILPNNNSREELLGLVQRIGLHCHKRVMNSSLQFEHDFKMTYNQPLVPDKGAVLDDVIEVYKGHIAGGRGARIFYKFPHSPKIAESDPLFENLHTQYLYLPSDKAISGKRDSENYELYGRQALANLTLYRTIRVKASVIYGEKDYDSDTSEKYKTLYGIKTIGDLIGTWICINDFNFMTQSLDKEAMTAFMRGGHEAAKYKPIIEFRVPAWDGYIRPEQNKSKCDIKRCEPWLESLSYIIQGFLRKIASNEAEDNESEESASEESILEDNEAEESGSEESVLEDNVAPDVLTVPIAHTISGTTSAVAPARERQHLYCWYPSVHIEQDVETSLDEVIAVKIGVSKFDVGAPDGWSSAYGSYSRTNPFPHIMFDCYEINTESNTQTNIERALWCKLKNAGFKFVENDEGGREFVIVKDNCDLFRKLWTEFKAEFTRWPENI